MCKWITQIHSQDNSKVFQHTHILSILTVIITIPFQCSSRVTHLQADICIHWQKNLKSMLLSRSCCLCPSEKDIPTRPMPKRGVCLFVGCLTSQQHVSVSQGRICSDNFMHSHTDIEVADQTFHLTQSQYIDTRPTSPSTDPIMSGAWQGKYWSANY